MVRSNAVTADDRVDPGGIDLFHAARVPAYLEPEAVAEVMADVSEYVIRRVRDVVHSADDAVRDNPWTVVGIGALLGLTAGFLLSRRS